MIRGEFDDVEGRLLFSTFTVFGTSVTTLACGLAWERGRLGVVPLLGIALGLLFGLVMIVVIWAEPDVGEAWGKAYGTEIAVAVAANVHESQRLLFSWAEFLADTPEEPARKRRDETPKLSLFEWAREREGVLSGAAG